MDDFLNRLVFVIVSDIVFVIVFVIVCWPVRSYLLITLIKCLRGPKNRHSWLHKVKLVKKIKGVTLVDNQFI